MIHENPETEFAEKEYLSDIDDSAFIHPLAAVIGNVIIGKKVMVSPFASVRGDEGQPIFVGDESNIQDGVVIHALETDNQTGKNLIEVDNKKCGQRCFPCASVAGSWPCICGRRYICGNAVAYIKDKDWKKLCG